MQDSTQVPDVTRCAEEPAGKTDTAARPTKRRGEKVRAMLRARFGDDVYDCWFHSLEFDNFDGRTVRASVPVKFLQTWIQAHYADGLLECCKSEFEGVERLEVVTREFGAAAARARQPTRPASPATRPPLPAEPANAGPRRVSVGPGPALTRTNVNGFEGSPLDPKYTFESFVEGKANRIAHAAAAQVAATVLDEQRPFNPLYLHSPVGPRQDASACTPSPGR